VDKKIFPDRITLELTNRCNLSCTMCPRQHMTYPLGDMDCSLFKRLIDEMADNGARILVPFFRGESVLHPQFIELLSYAKNKNMEIQLATNGSLLTPETGAALIDIDIDFISFSVDRIDNDQYRKMRRGGRLSKVLEGIETFIRQKKQKQNTHTMVQVSAVDTGFSSEEKQGFIKYWKNKVNRIRIYPQHTQNGKFGSLGNGELSTRQVCRKPFTEMVVYWDGVVASCNHDWNRADPLGNTVEKSLKEIWNNPIYNEFRHRHNSLSFSREEPCQACDHWVPSGYQNKVIGELHESDDEVVG
jgi:radical SAM protein with 4Fe4S-binding SPASM domain